MPNLKVETTKKLKENGKSPKDVLWVGNHLAKMTWETFANVADKKYDNGFGGAEVKLDLLVVGDGWWLERYEYDGSERWEFKTLAKAPTQEIEEIGIADTIVWRQW